VDDHLRGIAFFYHPYIELESLENTQEDAAHFRAAYPSLTERITDASHSSPLFDSFFYPAPGTLLSNAFYFNMLSSFNFVSFRQSFVLVAFDAPPFVCLHTLPNSIRRVFTIEAIQGAFDAQGDQADNHTSRGKGEGL